MFKKFALPLFVSALLVVAAAVSINDWGLAHRISYIDKIYHFLGGALAAWLVDLYVGRGISANKLKRFLIIVAGACFVGVAWEIVEWLSSAYAPRFSPFLAHYMGIGTLEDTLGDLVIDSLGASLYGATRLSRGK